MNKEHQEIQLAPAATDSLKKANMLIYWGRTWTYMSDSYDEIKSRLNSINANHYPYSAQNIFFSDLFFEIQ